MFPIIKLRIIQLKYDYKRILIMIALTMLLAFIFGYSSTGDYTLKVGIVDNDNTKISKELIKKISEDKEYEFIKLSSEDAKENIKSNSIKLSLIIEKGFEESLLKSSSVSVSVLSSESDLEVMNIEFLIKSKILKIYKDYNSAININNIILENNKTLIREKTLSEIYNSISTDSKEYIKINVETSENSAKKYDNTLHSIFGMTIMFVAFTIVFSIANILEDKELGVFNRMLISPIKRFSIIWQSMIVSIILGVGQIFIILYLSSIIFDVNYSGNYLGVFIVALVFVYAISALGFLVSMFVKTYAQLSVIMPIVLTSFAMIGGCMWPLEIVSSKLLITLSYFVPHRWAIEALTDILVRYKTLGEVVKPIFILIIMGAVFTVIGSILLNKFSEKIS